MFRVANAGLGLFVLRVVLGIVFLMHGLGKLVGPPFVGTGMDATIAFFSQLGIPAPGAAAWFVGILETVGGLALILGAAVHIFALLLAIDMLVAILKVHLPQGYAGPMGYEFPLVLLAGLVCLMLSGPGIMAVHLRGRVDV